MPVRIKEPDALELQSKLRALRSLLNSILDSLEPESKPAPRATTNAADPERYLRAVEVAEMLSVHEVTLQQWRARGEGPKWIKLGRKCIRYRPADVLAWSAARMVGK